MSRDWRCSECGCSEKTALRRRKRLSLRIKVIAFNARTCTPKCGLARERRRWREKYGRAYWRRLRPRQSKRAKS